MNVVSVFSIQIRTFSLLIDIYQPIPRSEITVIESAFFILCHQSSFGTDIKLRTLNWLF